MTTTYDIFENLLDDILSTSYRYPTVVTLGDGTRILDIKAPGYTPVDAEVNGRVIKVKWKLDPSLKGSGMNESIERSFSLGFTPDTDSVTIKSATGITRVNFDKPKDNKPRKVVIS